MSLIKAEIDNNVLNIELYGKIDSSNGNDIQNEIDRVISENTVSTVIIDAEKLDYISSIGLRIILGIKKKFDDLRIINVNNDVYNIFDITKYTDIINIQKAYRNISVDNCVQLGKGFCGTVYKLDDETIIKVFVDNYEYEKIAKERENSQNAFINGIDTAIPFDIVKLGDNFGLVYEIINADTLKNVMLRERDNLEYYIGVYADFVKKMHSTVFKNDCYAEMRGVWLKKIDSLEDVFTDAEKEAVKKMISRIPERKTFNHGDINLGNLMVNKDEAVLIDMEDAVLGHPIYDISFIYYLLKLLPDMLPSELCAELMSFTKKENTFLWNKFCENYFGAGTPEARAKIEAEIHPYGMVKLMEAITILYDVIDHSISEDNKEVLTEFRSTVEKYKKDFFDIIDNVEGSFTF